MPCNKGITLYRIIYKICKIRVERSLYKFNYSNCLRGVKLGDIVNELPTLTLFNNIGYLSTVDFIMKSMLRSPRVQRDKRQY